MWTGSTGTPCGLVLLGHRVDWFYWDTMWTSSTGTETPCGLVLLGHRVDWFYWDSDTVWTGSTGTPCGLVLLGQRHHVDWFHWDSDTVRTGLKFAYILDIRTVASAALGARSPSAWQTPVLLRSKLCIRTRPLRKGESGVTTWSRTAGLNVTHKQIQSLHGTAHTPLMATRPDGGSRVLPGSRCLLWTPPCLSPMCVCVCVCVCVCAYTCLPVRVPVHVHCSNDLHAVNLNQCVGELRSPSQ
ncbi:hypothetical protein EYF80_057652 [Liparis tanakae]|uniref:Uncharacterized protein n=1 Tax=Liparis tanakae TaxID=230148 RepID=A0A4Z2ETS0_9TELE|nr:hypothetical protein EYF80_057652 [Liparis tanakae]